MVYRSSVGPYGPWEANPGNPIVFNGRKSGCHFTLSGQVLCVLTPLVVFVVFVGNSSNLLLSTGHADIVQTPKGDWWAVFLGTRELTL